jgi:hypothetical protein
MSELTERLAGELRLTVDPLRDLLDELDADILAHERELSELRELRRGIKTALSALDPKPKPKPTPKPTAPKPLTQGQEEKLKRVRGHLLAKDVHEDITAPGLKENGLGDPPISLGALYAILNELHEQDFLRLDRLGRGGQRVYRKAIP